MDREPAHCVAARAPPRWICTIDMTNSKKPIRMAHERVRAREYIFCKRYGGPVIVTHLTITDVHRHDPVYEFIGVIQLLWGWTVPDEHILSVPAGTYERGRRIRVRVLHNQPAATIDAGPCVCGDGMYARGVRIRGKQGSNDVRPVRRYREAAVYYVPAYQFSMAAH